MIVAKEDQVKASIPFNVLADVSAEFTWVTTNKPIAETLKRDVAGGALEKTGYLLLNAEGSVDWDDVVEAWGMDPENTGTIFGVNEANRTVAAVPGDTEAPGVVRVVRTPDRLAHVMHLGNVFAEHRSLRPTGKQSVLIYMRTGKNGKPYLLIDLKTGQTMNTTTREGSKEHQKRAETKARREAKRSAKAGDQGQSK